MRSPTGWKYLETKEAKKTVSPGDAQRKMVLLYLDIHP